MSAQKIEVSPEGREGIYIPSKESLISFIDTLQEKTFHNFVQSGGALIGADHEKSSLIYSIKSADRVALLFGSAKSNNLNHSLAVIKKNKLEMYDVPVELENLKEKQNEK